MYVCMHAFMYACMHACMYIYGLGPVTRLYHCLALGVYDAVDI